MCYYSIHYSSVDGYVRQIPVARELSITGRARHFAIAHLTQLADTVSV